MFVPNINKTRKKSLYQNNFYINEAIIYIYIKLILSLTKLILKVS